ncbi:hypothetical protein D0469_13655 [Peribacillus saganii]|uniref:DUF4234 domain-containing protein n=1 Tax=Peribacillus saganii TaxID=2303992 RepID=A0A372LM18_9BACI|nr:DUF4234 domain-containing protein [Peribacillus saganii]RFU67768.1 hypothetical protein D0469_13655 [Peribacillus saganii]
MANEKFEWGFKKVSVWLVILLTAVTLGAYLGYWFLKERETLKTADKRRLIPVKVWWVFTVLLGISFLHNFIGGAVFTPYGNALFTSFDVIFSFYFLGLLYYSVFRVRDLLEDRYQEDIFKPWLLVLFHVWYLQFKINRLEGTGNEKQSFKEAVAK